MGHAVLVGAAQVSFPNDAEAKRALGEATRVASETHRADYTGGVTEHERARLDTCYVVMKSNDDPGFAKTTRLRLRLRAGRSSSLAFVAPGRLTASPCPRLSTA